VDEPESLERTQAVGVALVRRGEQLSGWKLSLGAAQDEAAAVGPEKRPGLQARTLWAVRRFGAAAS
jgi:hypothetical protein